ncbi:MAG: GIY-YIG nuclease family protein [Flavobacteriales bacterium]|nr:MAG: GIY-YIG nuclease family protein [Flavobacteriales bacterium]QQR85555.1 MAG: GIY-YIG nuclease family protein [Flavobacteriales bacterium]
MAWLYILFSQQLDRYYIGHTEHSVAERLQKHLGNHKAWTGRAKDWEVVYQEHHPNKSAAMRREREIKNWKSRVRLQTLCASGPERPAS